MAGLRQGLWIYLLLLLALFAGGFYLSFREHHPSISSNQLIDALPQHIIYRDSPCAEEINGASPFSISKNIAHFNIFCPDKTSSYNFLLLDVLPKNPTLADAVKQISGVNHFQVVFSKNYQIISAGNIKDQDGKFWLLKVDGKVVSDHLDRYEVGPGNTIEMVYE